MALLLTVASSLITFVVGRNIGHYDGRIVNGEPISASQYPWMVSLRQEVEWSWWWKQQNQFCGGSLIEITPPIILTAAHCMDIWSYNKTDGTVRDSLGNINRLYADINRTYDLAENVANDTYWTLNFTISDIHIHPLWTGDLFQGYDIALIILDEFVFNQSDIDIDIEYYKTLLPKVLTSNNYDDDTQCCSENEDLIVIGYGDLEDEGDSSPRLKTTDMKYVDAKECGEYLVNKSVLIEYNVTNPGYSDDIGVSQDKYEDYKSDIRKYVKTTALNDDRIVCVIGDNTDLCQGDSGGPLFRIDSTDNKAEIIGVASFVMGDCNDGYPSGYTNNADYDHWIQSTISWEAYGISYDPTPSPTRAPNIYTDTGYRYQCVLCSFSFFVSLIISLF